MNTRKTDKKLAYAYAEARQRVSTWRNPSVGRHGEAKIVGTDVHVTLLENDIHLRRDFIYTPIDSDSYHVALICASECTC